MACYLIYFLLLLCTVLVIAHRTGSHLDELRAGSGIGLGVSETASGLGLFSTDG